jgi:hypothetical protein
MKKIYLLLFIVISISLTANVEAQVSKYTFSSSVGTYTPVTGGTVWLSGNTIATDIVSPEITLPFVFNFNNRDYTSIRINPNGYFQLGTAFSSPSGLTYFPLSTPVGNTASLYEGAISAAGTDLENSTMTVAKAEIRYENIGNEFVVQFKDVAGKFYPSTNRMNFQVRLQQTTNKIIFVYGEIKANIPLRVEVGLRGAFGDVINRITTPGSNWSGTSAGSDYFNTALIDSIIFPVAGTTFEWTPPAYKHIPPVFHSLPFSESFDVTWADYDNLGQLPNDSNWRTWPSRGVTAWRRHNTDAGFGSASGWTNLNSSFTQPRTGGAARLSSYPIYIAGTPLYGDINLYLNFSSLGNKRLQFDYYGPDVKDSVVVYLSTDSGATFFRKGVFSNSSNTGWITKSLLLGNNVARNAVIKFRGYAGGSFDIGLDNVYVISENCGLVTGLDTSNVTTNSATLKWDTLPGTVTYNYEIRTGGYPGSGASGLVASGTANGLSVNVTGLSPTSEYTFYIRPSGANCAWSFPASFRTICSAVNVPYFEDFSSATPPYFDVCERVEDSIQGAGWRLSTDSVPGLRAPTIDSKSNGGWFFTRGINLTAGIKYSVSFKYFGYGSTLNVKAGTAQTSLGMTNNVVSLNSSTGIYYAKEGTGLIVPSASGIYYFGFHRSASYSPLYNDVFLDNILIQQTPPPPPCTANVLPVNGSNVNSQPVQMKWNKVNEATSYDVMVSDNGGSSYTYVQTVFDTTFGYSASLPDKTYYWYVVPKNAGVSAVNCSSAATSFKTNIGDECSAAILFTRGGIFNGTTVSATPSLNVPSCKPVGTPDDVWYSFISPYQEFAFAVTGGTNFKPVVSVFKGTCGSLTQVQCETTNYDSTYAYIYLNSLTQGATYYIRIYNGRPSAPGAFTITADVAIPLPVTITLFTGERNGTINKLTWTTETEQNNKGFELQRSADGEHFNTIAFIPSKAVNGNSTTTLGYDFNDIRPFAGHNFYKLKQMDKDGRSTYSSVVVVKGSKLNTLSLAGIYPNPANNNLHVIVASPANNTIDLVITDLAGRIIKRQVVHLISGDNTVLVDVGKLSSGVYMIKAICGVGCENAVSKFVKQ